MPSSINSKLVNEDSLKTEDDPKNKDDLKNEDDLRKEDDRINQACHFVGSAHLHL